VSVNWTHNLPLERRTLPLSYRRRSEIFVTNAQVSGDVMTCNWNVTEKPKIQEKG